MMANTIICRILPTGAAAFQGSGQAKGNNVVTLDIYPASGAAWQLRVAQPHDLKLHSGDKIKCVSGAAAVLINPGTPAGIFILVKQLPPNSDWKTRTELEINDETTRHIHRGNISVAKDIGTVLTGGTATTR